MKKIRFKIGIWAKIVFPTSILILILCIILGVVSCKSIERGMINMGVEEAQMAADIAVTMVDGNLLDAIKPGLEEYGGENYMAVLDSLKKIQKQCGIEFVYVLYSDDQQHVCYSVSNDDTAEKSTYGTDFGSPYSEFADVYAGGKYVQDYIDKTEFGNLISAYLPIYDDTGRVVGILGCDYEASNVLERINAARTNVILISGISIVLSLLILSLIIRGITKNLHKVDNKIYDLVNSEGDLTQKLDIATGDELQAIAENVNSLLEYIRGIMKSVAHNSTLLDRSTGTVVDSLASANEGISEVSFSMEQMSATMEETSASLYTMNEIIATIADTAASIADRARAESQSSDRISQKVQEIYNKAVQDKEDAAKQASEMSAVVNAKIESSRAVSRISALTDEILNITDQTSLLSLNASIEAARAGEAGRGFAVVASEIGSLAANSAKAAEQIQIVSNEVVAAVNDLAAEAEKMLHFMNDTAMAGYDKLLDNSTNYRSDVENLSKIMQGFSQASSELRENIKSIKTSIGEINTAVGENTESLVNVSGIASNLSQSMKNINSEANANMAVAKELNSEVGKFKI